jgi:hypothetical protein
MATQSKKKTAGALPSEKAAPETHKVKRDRNMELTRDDGGGFSFLGSSGNNKKVIITPDGGITIGNK